MNVEGNVAELFKVPATSLQSKDLDADSRYPDTESNLGLPENKTSANYYTSLFDPWQKVSSLSALLHLTTENSFRCA